MTKDMLKECSGCGVKQPTKDMEYCELCKTCFCSKCAEEDLMTEVNSPDDFKDVCRACIADRYDGGV